MKTTLHRLLPALALLSSAPALACGGPDYLTTGQYSVLVVALISAPLMAALLVDRVAFALAARARRLTRKHSPTLLGPGLALFALFVGVAGVYTRSIDVAFLGAVALPFAAVVSGLSFVRSVIIEQRGQPAAQWLRVGGVVGISSLLVLAFLVH